jgi:hypothetical protein
MLYQASAVHLNSIQQDIGNAHVHDLLVYGWNRQSIEINGAKREVTNSLHDLEISKNDDALYNYKKTLTYMELT